jgi:hypothetical protein
MIRLRHFGLALGGLLAAVSFAEPAKAQGVLDFAKNILGIQDEKPEIAYPERAPLVVPPKLQLREPQQPASAGNPNWPKDPDVEARRAAAEAAKGPSPELRNIGRSPVLSVDEMRAPGRRPSGATTTATAQPWPERPVLSVQEMRDLDAKGRASQQAPIVSGVEPPRRYLTDPPTGYRKPAPGAPVAPPQRERSVRILSDNDYAAGKD